MSKNVFSKEYVKKHRTFPTRSTVFFVILIIFQIIQISRAVNYDPEPKDIIDRYVVTVTPLEDGSLDIQYDITWFAMDEEEPLSWLTVGMANENFSVYKSSLSSAIRTCTPDINDSGYTRLRIDLRTVYFKGEEIQISFKINQRDMLCSGENGYFYEFVPGWFNEIPVYSYKFRWQKSEGAISAPGAYDDGYYYVWSGRFDCGEYCKMKVSYTRNAFEGFKTVAYEPFDDGGAYNGLDAQKRIIWIHTGILLAITLSIQISIIDSYVSYIRGRGFLSRYGYRVHLYGRKNPKYVKERAARASRSRGGGGGGGCACACACACAGGGRAGCSQKDTYQSPQRRALPQTDQSQGL